MEPTNFAALSLDQYKGVLIDLDDTLYRYKDAHEAALRVIHQDLPSPIDLETFHRTYRCARDKTAERLAPQGACRSRFFAFQDLAEDWKLPAPYSQAAKWEKLYWDSFCAAITPAHEALHFLKRCQNEGKPVCIVSDMTAAQQVQKIETLGLAPLIDYLVTSEEVGAEKPDPRMFECALRKLRLTAADVIMIGDSLPKDVNGAMACGIKAYLIDLYAKD